MVALDPEKAALCYLLCRSLGARRVVEAGTSFGVSIIYLAAAVRDNLAGGGVVVGTEREPNPPENPGSPIVAGTEREPDPLENPGSGIVAGTEHEPGKVAHPCSGIVVGTEHEPEKVERANANIAAAGLADYVDVRAGDLRETLRDLDGPIDFMRVDIGIPMALPALRLVEPKLRRGALVVCDNVVRGANEYREYLDHVRDPEGPFTSVTVPGQGGIEISMKR